MDYRQKTSFHCRSGHSDPRDHMTESRPIARLSVCKAQDYVYSKKKKTPCNLNIQSSDLSHRLHGQGDVFSVSAGKTAVMLVSLPEVHTEPTLLKMTPDGPVGSGASAAPSVMWPSSCLAVRFPVCERATPSPPPPSPGPVLHLPACGTVGQEQTVLSFHCKHMVKLKCVIYLGLRVGQ